MDSTSINWPVVVNLVLSLTILVLGVKRYAQSGVRAFVFIGIGFLMFAISHLFALMHWDADLKTILAVIRVAGYVSVIIGLVM
jgi:hypothetical protein